MASTYSAEKDVLVHVGLYVGAPPAVTEETSGYFRLRMTLTIFKLDGYL